MIYKSEVMQQLMNTVDRVAPYSATVAILGESGTGKELVAKRIHEKSNRSRGPFVAINCGALRETLLESELFGHEKGSFTGAYTRKIGLAELAHGGTLFLDEVSELTQGMQAKLLRFLQEGEIYRVGGKMPIKVDVRLVSATNKDLDHEVEKGSFREDLYYRVNTITLRIPPLRKRKEDIPLLVEYFLTEEGAFIKPKEITKEAMKVLIDSPWYGNIRELQNFCVRARILTEGTTIGVKDLPETLTSPEVKEVGYSLETPLHEVEKSHVLKVLQYFEGNKSKTADALGITRKTLYNKLYMYGEFEE